MKWSCPGRNCVVVMILNVHVIRNSEWVRNSWSWMRTWFVDTFVMCAWFVIVDAYVTRECVPDYSDRECVTMWMRAWLLNMCVTSIREVTRECVRDCWICTWLLFVNEWPWVGAWLVNVYVTGSRWSTRDPWIPVCVPQYSVPGGKLPKPPQDIDLESAGQKLLASLPNLQRASTTFLIRKPCVGLNRTDAFTDAPWVTWKSKYDTWTEAWPISLEMSNVALLLEGYHGIIRAFLSCIYALLSGVYNTLPNPFTPKSNQCQISPAASPEILCHSLGITWLFVAYADKRWLYYQFSLPHLYISLYQVGECVFELGSERVKRVLGGSFKAFPFVQSRWIRLLKFKCLKSPDFIYLEAMYLCNQCPPGCLNLNPCFWAHTHPPLGLVWVIPKEGLGGQMQCARSKINYYGFSWILTKEPRVPNLLYRER